MNTKLTTDQIDEYRTNGALIYPSLLEESEIGDLLTAISEALVKMGANKVAGSSVLNEPSEKEQKKDDFYDGVFLQKLNLWKISELVKKVFLGAGLGEMVTTLEGVEGMRVWHDQTLQKMPWGNPTAWHLDNPYWSFYSRHAISIWIALDDATIQNGCLYYILGSQTEARFEKNVGIGQNTGGLFKEYPEWSKREPLIAEMKKGSCGFHNGLTAHGAGPNMTPYPRRAMTCGYMPIGSTFNGQKNILPAEYVATLNAGDVLENEDHNPVVYTK
jgi:phytanoyl-CoA hydroxylase